VLGQGAIYYDNAVPDLIGDKVRQERPNHRWVSLPSNSLFWFYLHLTQVLLAYSPDGLLDPSPYLKELKWEYTFDESK
jgi:hypothetical protein